MPHALLAPRVGSGDNGYEDAVDAANSPTPLPATVTAGERMCETDTERDIVDTILSPLITALGAMMWP